MEIEAPDVPIAPARATSRREAVAEYRRRHDTFKAAVEKVKTLIRDLCADAGVSVHKIEARAKTVGSFASKLAESGDRFKDPVREVQDLVGLRVIVHSLEEIALVSEVIDKNFQVVRSENKRDSLRPDQFGYQSLHKVFRLPRRRASLFEWSAFSGMVFEVQVRTVLQHAWAVTSHRLQYKRGGAVPPEQRRKLAQIASLLELADEQLLALSNSQQGAPGKPVGWSQGKKRARKSSTLWSDMLSPGRRRVLRPLSEPLCQRIVAAGRRAGIAKAEEQTDSLGRLASLWSAIELRLKLDPVDLLRRVDQDAESMFTLLECELRVNGGVTAWRASDAQLIVAATIIALGEPRQHLHIVKGWAPGYLKALRAVMHRVA
jgi:ppGpp synthetase/RelA/SpoT-type nucleotidyltranferase